MSARQLRLTSNGSKTLRSTIQQSPGLDRQLTVAAIDYEDRQTSWRMLRYVCNVVVYCFMLENNVKNTFRCANAMVTKSECISSGIFSMLYK